MELNNNDAAVCAEPVDEPADSMGEIDLYDELTAFAELSPEEQLRLVTRPEKTPKETENPIAPEVEEPTPPGPLYVHEPVEPGETPAASVSAALCSDAEVSNANVESQEVRRELLEVSITINPEEEAIVPAPQFDASAGDLNSPVEPSEICPESAEEATADELVDAEAIVPAAKSAAGPEDSISSVEPPEIRSGLFDRPRHSGPLGSLTLGYVFTGALSKGVCLACGAEAGTDDLFCISCGVFVDEIGSTLPTNPTCAECKQRIETDEIFCPWCGSTLSPAG